ncbi:helix-turn-helix domain-containing protein [Clostridium sp. CTA-7]
MDNIIDGDFITLEELEKRYINYALEKYGHDTKGKSKAAKKLGIGLATLYRKS